METAVRVHRAVDKLYDLGDEFRNQCVVAEKSKLGPNQDALGIEERHMRFHRVHRFGRVPSDSQGPKMILFLKFYYIEQLASVLNGQ